MSAFLLASALMLSAPQAQASPEALSYLPRVTARDGVFCLAETGEPFHPRGFQYIRLNQDGSIYALAPGQYNPDAVETMFADLEAHGYNLVRLFYDEAGVCDENGLNAATTANLVDFLRRATRHQVYVIPVPRHLRRCAAYSPYFDRADDELPDLPGRQYDNMRYLSTALIEGKCAYLKDLVAAVKRADPGLLRTLFAIELENESCFKLDGPLLSPAASPLRVPATGKTYALDDQDELQRLMDDAAVAWANACARAIREVDPEAMVSTSVFTYRAVGRSGPGHTSEDNAPDPRVPLRPRTLAGTDLSYVDIHLYVPNAAELVPQLASVEIEELKRACRQNGKPLFVGEVGALMPHYASPAAAAAALPAIFDALRASGFTGYCYWTYDCHEQPQVWNAKAGDGVIFSAISRLQNSLGQP